MTGKNSPHSPVTAALTQHTADFTDLQFLHDIQCCIFPSAYTAATLSSLQNVPIQHRINCPGFRC